MKPPLLHRQAPFLPRVAEGDDDARVLKYFEQGGSAQGPGEAPGAAVPMAGSYLKASDKKQVERVLKPLLEAREAKARRAAKELRPIAAVPLDAAFKRP